MRHDGNRLEGFTQSHVISDKDSPISNHRKPRVDEIMNSVLGIDTIMGGTLGSISGSGDRGNIANAPLLGSIFAPAFPIKTNLLFRHLHYVIFH